MIVRLTGRLLEAGSGRAVVDVHGVGYEVWAPESVLASLGEIGGEVSLFVRQIVREDDISLYGFLTADQRRLFDLLRDVKGCGARISLAVLSTLPDAMLLAAISTGDAKAITRAPGVGPKLADRLVLELKDKVAGLALAAKVTPTPATKSSQAPDELMAALMALGYRRGELEPIIDEVRESAETVEEQIRVALRRLSK